jgi:transposase
VKHFVAGTTARSAAALVDVDRHTATLFFLKLRELISARLEAAVPELLGGEIEIDESYFGGVRKGKRGGGASGKVPVFGLLKRGGNVHPNHTECKKRHAFSHHPPEDPARFRALYRQLPCLRYP